MFQEYGGLMTVLILIKHEGAYTEKKIIHARHSKPDKFVYSSIQI